MSELFSSLKISGAGLSVNRRKMNITAENIANAETTKTADGGPYRKKQIVIRGQDKSVDFNTELQRHRVQMDKTHLEHLNARKYYQGRGVEISLPQSEEAVDPRGKVKMIYDPSHPDANQDGWVEMPDINILIEMVNMMTASRAFEANTSALEASKNIYSASLDI